jgi:ATP-binding cassette subfamily B multidrug efflux pump
VPRFYDATQGEVLVDGVNVRDYELKTLRDKIGYVPQQLLPVQGTVESNVSYGDRPDEPEDVPVIDVSRMSGRKAEREFLNGGARAHRARGEPRAPRDATSRRPPNSSSKMQKKDSVAIAQGGSNVSGGQKQRLSIARAVYRHPEILIFDDSFSALDFKTDREVRDALEKETAKDSTKLIVAQRIGTIMNADRIIVLDDGKVVGQGTHEELLDTCEVYRQIAESQLSEEELRT